MASSTWRWLGWRRAAGDEIGGRHQHAGRTDAALGRTVRREGVAQPGGQPVRAVALNRSHDAARRPRRRQQAGAGLAAVER